MKLQEGLAPTGYIASRCILDSVNRTLVGAVLPLL